MKKALKTNAGADMSKATAREPGWYWVSYKGRDVVSEWDGSYWRLQASRAITDEVLEKIGPRIRDPEAAASDLTELLAALREAKRQFAHIGAMCGHPNTVEACRLNVGVAKRAQTAIDDALTKAEERR